MSSCQLVELSHRALFAVGGADRRDFLQGLVTADVPRASGGAALYGAFLTPQGKFLHEFFLAEQGDRLLLETERDRLADFVKRLSIYKLRAQVTIAPLADWRVFAAIGEDAAQEFGLAGQEGAVAPLGGGLALVDPRLKAAGLRLWLPADGADALAGRGEAAPFAAWDGHRIGLGLPDGSRDMTPDKALLLENGFDELNGVDWQKGCYLGQELTARTKYRGLVKKRLLPVEIDGPAPEAGTILTLDGEEAGEMRSHCGDRGLALIRLESFEKAAGRKVALAAGEARLVPGKPDWMRG